MDKEIMDAVRKYMEDKKGLESETQKIKLKDGRKIKIKLETIYKESHLNL